MHQRKNPAGGGRSKKKYVYSAIHSSDERMLLFRRVERAHWREDRYIAKGFRKDEDSFLIGDELRHGTNVIYLRDGCPVRSPNIWVLPGGGDDGIGSSHAYTEIEEEVGFPVEIMKSYDAEVKDFEKFSITFIKVNDEILIKLMEQANLKYQECEEYKAKLLSFRTIADAKAFVENRLPPLVSHELCECKIVSIDEALECFAVQPDCDWFVEGLLQWKRDAASS